MLDGAHELVIAIDGPSGSGKSTVAQAVANRLGLRYLDTGAMYRAVTAVALDRGVDLADDAALAALAHAVDLEITTDPRPARIVVDRHDYTSVIRTDEVTRTVSIVSAVPAVRDAMVARQRAIIADGGIVIEGRDIATAVVPNAPVKVFLTAAEPLRAARRAQQDEAPIGATEEAIARRDQLDSKRAASPMTQAPDAVVIDSTDLDAEQVADRIVALATAATSGGVR